MAKHTFTACRILNGDGFKMRASMTLVRYSLTAALLVACGGTNTAGTTGTNGGTGQATGSSTGGGANTFRLGGSVTGLRNGTVVLEVKATSTGRSESFSLGVSENTTFSSPAFAANGMSYEVSVLVQPSSPAQTCEVNNGSGVVNAADVTNIQVTCATDRHTLSVRVTGLEGSGLSFTNGTDTAAASGNDTFVVSTLDSGSAWALTVGAQPTSPWQTCTIIDQAEGTIGNADTVVDVVCVTNRYHVIARVSGLVGDGVTLRQGNDSASTAFNNDVTFDTLVASGEAYEVSVSVQPRLPGQLCVASSGVVAGADVIVPVSCATIPYKLYVDVNGLQPGTSVEIQHGNTTAIRTANDTASLLEVEAGSPILLTVAHHPESPWQTCVFDNAGGVMPEADTTRVLTCSINAYPLGFSVSGLVGQGLAFADSVSAQTLTLNGPATTGAFATQVTSGSDYTVGITQQPTAPWQTCVLNAPAFGQVAGAALALPVACTTDEFDFDLNTSGLTDVSGATVTLSTSGGETPFEVTASGSLPIGPVPSGEIWALTVTRQPNTQKCTLAATSGTIAGSAVSVALTCVDSFPINVTVNGLVAGASALVLSNLTDSLSFVDDGDGTVVAAFPRRLAAGDSYSVAVAQHPRTVSNQAYVCTTTDPLSGTMPSVPVDLTYNCAPGYRLGGVVSGLTGAGLVLRNLETGENVAVSSGNSTFEFSPLPASDTDYSITVDTQPESPWQTCVVSNGLCIFANDGCTATADVLDIAVTCTTRTFTLGVNVTGADPEGLIQFRDVLRDADPAVGSPESAVSVNAAGTFELSDGAAPVQYPSGTAYQIVVDYPTGDSTPQECEVENPSGTIGGVNQVLQVNCRTRRFSVGGVVNGLPQGNVSLLLDYVTDSQTLSAAGGAFAISPGVPAGSPYTVSVASQPNSPRKICAVTAGSSGTMGISHVTDVVVDCQNAFVVKGSVTGLTASGLELGYNNNPIVVPNGSTTYETSAATEGTVYSLSIGQQPAGLRCTLVGNVSGSGGATDITVDVQCAPVHDLAVEVSGLLGRALQISNGSNTFLVDGETTINVGAFATGETYALSVVNQPFNPRQTCDFTTNPTGTMPNNDRVIGLGCHTNTYTVGGTVIGRTGALALKNNNGLSLNVTSNSFRFTQPVASGQTFNVTVANAAQSCEVFGGQGTVASENINSVLVICDGGSYTVGGEVVGLWGTGMVLANGDDTVTINANGRFVFPFTYSDTTAYTVAVQTPPSLPPAMVPQDCIVEQGTGQIAGTHVNNILVRCDTARAVTDSPNPTIGPGPNVSCWTGPASSYSESVVITDNFEIGDVTLRLDLQHGWVGDLEIYLRHDPDTGSSGDEAEAWALYQVGPTNCGDSSNIDGVYSFNDRLGADLDAAASAPDVDTNDLIPAGVYRSAVNDGINPLRSLHGRSAAGTWTLFVLDHTGTDSGVLRGWELLLQR